MQTLIITKMNMNEIIMVIIGTIKIIIEKFKMVELTMGK
jgi:hypothetical protein